MISSKNDFPKCTQYCMLKYLLIYLDIVMCKFMLPCVRSKYSIQAKMAAEKGKNIRKKSPSLASPKVG